MGVVAKHDREQKYLAGAYSFEMQIRVDLNGWEHECCGLAYEINDIVTLDLYLPVTGELAGDAHYMESHHGMLSGSTNVTGRVVGVEVSRGSDEFVATTRLPSGNALRGFDDDDNGDLIDPTTQAVLDIDPDEFIVILEVAEGTEFPTKRALAVG